MEAGWQQPASFLRPTKSEIDEKERQHDGAQIQTIGNALAVDLVAQGTAAISLAMVAAGVAWILRLLRKPRHVQADTEFPGDFVGIGNQDLAFVGR